MYSTLVRSRFRYFLFVVPLIVPMVGIADDNPTLTLNERAYLASRVYASLGNFAHWQDVPGLDVEAAYRKYLEKALASEERFAFSQATMEFLAEFHNGHTMFMDQEMIRRGGSLPFTARFVEGKWVIASSRTDELKPGDVIESIDGQPFEDFFRARRALIAASTEPWGRRALFARVPAFAPYAHLFPERFDVVVAGRRKAAIDRRAISDVPLPPTEGRWLEPQKLAYIRIPSFFTPEYQKQAVELVREYRDAPGLIVDVRGNMGGSTPGELTSLLMDRPYRWWTESTPVTMPYFKFRASQGTWQYEPFDRPEFLWRGKEQLPSKDHFQGKLVLLVDAGCHSACEDFTMPFKNNGRAVLVGETTAGSTGQPFVLDIGNEMVVMVGAKREMFPDGGRFEGIGIKPDVEVVPTIEDIRKGRDSALEAARKTLEVTMPAVR